MKYKEALRILKAVYNCDNATYYECARKQDCKLCEHFYTDDDFNEALKVAESTLETVIKHKETFEWCHDCKEYDQENHCCHRWNKCIRETISDNREHWYNEGFEDGKIHACSEGALREAYEQGKEEGYQEGYKDAENRIYDDTWDSFPD